MPSWLIIVGAVIVIYTIYYKFIRLQEYYDVQDYPVMQEFHQAFNEIKSEAESVRDFEIHDIQRSRNVWSGSKPEQCMKFAEKYANITGWLPAWSPGTSAINYRWTNFPLIALGVRFENNLKYCPKLNELITKYQDRINIAGFSLMTPGSEIPAHTDDTGIKFNSLAYHLGLVVPESGKCNLIVNGIEKIQQEGQSIIFDSTYEHSAQNNTLEDRIILYMDFKIPDKKE